MAVSVSRRGLGLSLGAAALAGPFIRGTRARAAESADVVVIGAGLSGLNAAWIMAEAGLDVVVLEGASRLGGRVWTAYDSELTPELGASQVGPSYARVIDAIDRLGLDYVDEDRGILPFAYGFEGQLFDAKDWADHPLNRTQGSERKIAPLQLGGALLAQLNPMKELDDWLRPDFAKYDVSVAELLAANGASPAAMKLTALTHEMHETSALGLMQEGFRGAFEAQFAGARTERIGGALVTRPAERAPGEKVETAAQVARWPKNIKGGCWKLPEAMAARLSRPVMLDKIVAAIDMDDDGVDVRCIDGTVVRAKFAISAIPFATLRTVEITPTPDRAHFAAIHHMGYAETTRAFCTIKEPFWLQDGLPPSLFTDSAIRMLWVLDNHSGAPGAPTKGPFRATFVLSWSNAERVSMMDPARAAAFLTAELERVRPAAKGQLTVHRFHSWGRQPLQRGCRHSFRPGQIAAFANDMILPWQRLHFAGEHTRRLDYGMESAFESGERAATEVLGRA
ncbi:MAG: FAD-dependent oxidoreductase [Rhodospirillaceae bacterium]|nr:FAD-dependent oxidoreductase [Rhodospirillaceae bacterium]